MKWVFIFFCLWSAIQVKYLDVDNPIDLQLTAIYLGLVGMASLHFIYRILLPKRFENPDDPHKRNRFILSGTVVVGSAFGSGLPVVIKSTAALIVIIITHVF